MTNNIISENHDSNMSDCAGLDYSRGKVSLAVVGDPAWHGRGTVVREAMTSQDALSLANLADWNIQKVPMIAATDPPIEVPDSYAVVRETGGGQQVIGTVGNRYEIVSNEEMADFADALVREGSARYETAGALAGGSQCWMLMRTPDYAIGREEMESYFMFGWSHDGSGAIRCIPTDVRVVCKNTHSLATRNRSKGFSMRHTKNVRRNIVQAQEALGLAQIERERIRELGEACIARQLSNPIPFLEKATDSIVVGTIAKVPVTFDSIRHRIIADKIGELSGEEQVLAQKGFDRLMNRRANVMRELEERYATDRNGESPLIGGSLWAAVQTVTEFHSHSSQVRYRGDRAENRFRSLIEGKGAESIREVYDLAAATLAS